MQAALTSRRLKSQQVNRKKIVMTDASAVNEKTVIPDCYFSSIPMNHKDDSPNKTLSGSAMQKDRRMNGRCMEQSPVEQANGVEAEEVNLQTFSKEEQCLQGSKLQPGVSKTNQLLNSEDELHFAGQTVIRKGGRSPDETPAQYQIPAFGPEVLTSSLTDVLGRKSPLESRLGQARPEQYDRQTSLQFQNQALIQGFRGQASVGVAQPGQESQLSKAETQMKHRASSRMRNEGTKDLRGHSELDIQNQLRIQT